MGLKQRSALSEVAAHLMAAKPDLSPERAVQEAARALRGRGRESTLANRSEALKEARRRTGANIGVTRAADIVPLKPDGTRWRLPSLVEPLRSEIYDPNAAMPLPEWAIKHVIPKAGLCVLYGESNAGKSFAAVHAAQCSAYGLRFFGKKVTKGAVVYVAAEAPATIQSRLKQAENALAATILAENAEHAVRAEPALKPAPIYVVKEAPTLCRDGQPERLVETVERAFCDLEAAGVPLSLVILDTWHASLGGADDNLSKDVGFALAPLRGLCERWGLATLIVAHPGKNLDLGLRGSNSLRAAVDVAIELRVPDHEGERAKPADAVRVATVTKARDFEGGGQFHFKLRVIEIARDEEGLPVTTCAVEPCGPPSRVEGGKLDSRFVIAFQEATADLAPGTWLPMKELRARYYAKRREDKTDTKRKGFDRALEAARDAGYALDENDEFIWRLA